MVRLREENRFANIARRPSIFAPPCARNLDQIRIRSMPMLHINDQLRIPQHARVPALEPVIPPAHRLLAPLDLGAGDRVVRKCVVPGADDGLQWSLRLLQHVGDAISIAVEQTANDKARDLDLAVGPNGTAPERTVVLML